MSMYYLILFFTKTGSPGYGDRCEFSDGKSAEKAAVQSAGNSTVEIIYNYFTLGHVEEVVKIM
jgi:hypothetical protein